MKQSAEYGLIGYFFVFPPEDTQRWRNAEMPYRYFFYPLIMIEYGWDPKLFPGIRRAAPLSRRLCHLGNRGTKKTEQSRAPKFADRCNFN